MHRSEGGATLMHELDEMVSMSPTADALAKPKSIPASSRLPTIPAGAPQVGLQRPTRASRNDARYRRVLVLVDLCAALGAMAVARCFEGVGVLHWDLVSAALLPLLAKLLDLYDMDRVTIRRSTLDEAPRLFMLAAVWAVLWSLLTIPLGMHLIWHASGGVGLVWACLCATIVIGRSGLRTVAKRVSRPERVLIAGGSRARQALAHSLSTDPAARIEVVGYLPLDDERRESVGLPAGVGQERRQRRQGLHDLPGMVERLKIDRVLLVSGVHDSDLMLEALYRVNELGITVSLLPRLFEVVGSAVEFDNVGGVTVLGLRRPGLSRSSLLIKRLMDLLGAGFVVALTSPIFLVFALAIRLDSPGPIFFRQKRVGRGGEMFEILKFRSMVVDAEAQRAVLAADNETEGLFKMANDPRVTRVGRLMRKISIDELPQLLNVLRGDMSLVGPRPLVPAEDVLVEGRHRDRLALAPGMTGPWQILGPHRPPLSEMVKTDYLYAVTWSLWLDVKLMLRTIAHVRSGLGR